MTINFKKIAIASLLAVLTVSSFAQAATDTGPVAVVNGSSIDQSTFYHAMEFLPDVGTLVGKQYVQVTPGLMALDQLITEQLLIQLAKKQSVTPSTDQIDQLYRAALAANPMMETDWTESGRALPELRLKYELEATRFNLLTQGIIVTDQEVQTQYTQHPDLYTIPKRIHLQVIILSSPDQESDVDAALKAGTSFSDVAKKYSEDITKSQGGDFGNIPEANLPDYFKTAIQNVKIGDTSAWSTGNSQDGRTFYFKALFVNATPSTKLPLDDSLKSSIRNSLMEDRGSKIHDIGKELSDLRDQSTITISNKVLSEQYKTMLSKLKTSGS